MHGPHQADISFLDQIQQGKAAVDIALGNRNDETQVGPHELLHCLKVAILDPLGQLDFLDVSQEWGLSDFPQVKADWVVDEIGIEALQHIQIPFEIRFRLQLVRHLGLDLFRNFYLIVTIDVVTD